MIPASLGVLLQLPAPQLKDALKICPELKAPLLEYAQSLTENQIGNVSDSVMQILSGGIADSFSEPNKSLPIPIVIKTEPIGEDLVEERCEPAPPGMD